MKIKITNVGRISEAVVELKNFIMFLGKNDSGKTYAASSIWALINLIKNIPEGKAIPVKWEISKFLNGLRREVPIGE